MRRVKALGGGGLAVLGRARLLLGRGNVGEKDDVYGKESEASVGLGLDQGTRDQ